MILATGQNSPNCQEEDLINPVADSLITFQDHIVNCQEEVILMGKPHTEEWKKRMSEMNRGENNPNYGNRMCEESRKRISEYRKTHPMPEEARRKQAESLKGKRKGWHHTEKQKKHLSEIKKKNPSCYWKGKKLSEEHKKKLSEVRKGRTPWNKGKEFLKGEKNPRWLGGISFEPYCHKFNDGLKESIRERDNRTCQLCGIKEEEHFRKLDVHHIHYDKLNCDPDLISLCMKCNQRVNAKRDYHENLFMEKLRQKGLI